jgi:hypothetical protein
MSGGRVQREIIEMASTDLRSLFRTAEGMTPLSCLLAVAQINRGVGEVAPLRLEAATGTIAGVASFDLNRQVLDLVIGSEGATTGFFALDIPMRVSGSFADPSIRPARWSPEGRARLSTSRAVAAVPTELRDFARGNRCYQAVGNTIRPVPSGQQRPIPPGRRNSRR